VTERQTDGQTHDDSNYRDSIASRGKNKVVCGSYGQVKVTENSATRESACEFVLAIHCNYVPILRSF